MSDAVLYEVDDDGVCLITLNRPEAGNSWCDKFIQA
jgi:enoyl-CoA hydratase/carnithine racemase